MWMLLYVPALADGLPWECPPIVSVVDAAVYRNTDAGLEDTFAALESAAMVFWDDGCAWIETTTYEGTTTTTERVCEGLGSTVTWTESARHDMKGSGSDELDTWALVVEVPSGAPWTRLALASTDAYRSSSGLSYGHAYTWSASWTGVFDGLPDDGWFEIDASSSTSSGNTSRSAGADTPGCAWSWSGQDYGDSGAEKVHAAGRVVEVATGYDYRCEGSYAIGSLDEAVVGAVDRVTWERDLADADGDGWVSGTCDCDDADPARYEAAGDVANDGIDQDCDGADRVDWDLDDDGHDAPAFGGDDCDDRRDDTFPGAREDAGDGVDQDCDGADDVDADGDGFTADGDTRRADCDDADDESYPGRWEVPCDGVDQDCDGEDSCPPPEEEEPEDTADEEEDTADEEPPPAAAVEEEPGCAGGGAAWLLFVPLAGIRRRRGGAV